MGNTADCCDADVLKGFGFYDGKLPGAANKTKASTARSHKSRLSSATMSESQILSAETTMSHRMAP